MHAIKSIFILLTLKFALVSACDVNYRHTCESHDDRPGPRESPIVLRATDDPCRWYETSMCCDAAKLKPGEIKRGREVSGIFCTSG
ncbi:hypothetical protein PGT21_002591 [Puccinia graminis f. sp. tritici]|uniref:Secreted protein n=1 Tax=Puccinia graminis f. sp. tritici TaxID=56615 RepID=A0A5B0PJH1_PUCGR|nr:hypothetical protein PGT21_002591 [Puccinia graminis f. sp. tritici]